MTEKLGLYRCNICGNVVQTILTGSGELVCCGQPMEMLVANTNENVTLEKHVPVFNSYEENGVEVLVGAEPHPMLNEHYIMFIETMSEDKNHVTLDYLYPAGEPKVSFKDRVFKDIALEYCNIHGLWEGKNVK